MNQPESIRVTLDLDPGSHDLNISLTNCTDEVRLLVTEQATAKLNDFIRHPYTRQTQLVMIAIVEDILLREHLLGNIAWNDASQEWHVPTGK